MDSKHFIEARHPLSHKWERAEILPGFFAGIDGYRFSNGQVYSNLNVLTRGDVGPEAAAKVATTKIERRGGKRSHRLDTDPRYPAIIEDVMRRLNKTAKYEDIAKKWKVPPSTIRSLQARLVKNGVRFPKRKRTARRPKNSLKAILKALRETKPEIFN